MIFMIMKNFLVLRMTSLLTLLINANITMSIYILIALIELYSNIILFLQKHGWFPTHGPKTKNFILTIKFYSILRMTPLLNLFKNTYIHISIYILIALDELYNCLVCYTNK